MYVLLSYVFTKEWLIHFGCFRIICAHSTSNCGSKTCGRISTNSVANGAFAKICFEQCWRQEVRSLSKSHSSAFAQESITSAIRYILGCALYDKVVDRFYRDSWGFLVLFKDSKTGLGYVLSQKTKILEHFKEIPILPL